MFAIIEESGVRKSTVDDRKLWHVVVDAQSVLLGRLAFAGIVLDHPLRVGCRYCATGSGDAFLFWFSLVVFVCSVFEKA